MSIIIYLDTQDYSRFTKKHQTAPERRIYKFLCEKVEKRQIVIPISYPIVMELLQNYSEEYRADRLARAEMMSNLSKGYALPFFSDLVSCEPILSKSYEWMPRDLFDVEKWMQDFASACIREGLPFELASAIYEKKQRKKIFKRVPSLLDTQLFKTDLLNILPHEVVNQNLFRRYALCHLSRKSANSRLAKAFGSPTVFINLWLGKHGFVNDFVLRSHTVTQVLSDAISKLIESKGKAKEVEKAGEELIAAFRDEFSTKQIKQIKKISRRLKTSYLPSSRHHMNLANLLPDFLYYVLDAYIHSGVKKDSASFKSSDFADISHALYIPYCDLWRGDSHFSSILISGNIPYKDKVVPKLELLEERANELLN